MKHPFEDYLKKEDLHDDLLPWIDDGVFPMVKHPLIMMFYHNGHASLVNKAYDQKCKMRDEYVKQKDYRSIIEVCYEKPYRVNALMTYRDYLSDEGYWQTLASIWTSTEFIHDNHDLWGELFSDSRGCRSAMMDSDEQAELAALPAQVTIYRGGTQYGWSWTLDRDKAKWFANRFDQGLDVHKRTVNKSSVIALLNHRDEHEIIWLGAKK